MIDQGIRVLRLTNERVLNDTEGVLDEIANYLPLPLGDMYVECQVGCLE